MQQARASPEANAPPQEGCWSLQASQMGHGLGGKKVLTPYQQEK